MTHKPVTLETGRLILRPHGLDDFAAMVKLWSAPQVTQFISGARAQTEEEVWQRLLRYRGLWPLLGFGYFVLTEKTSGSFVGEAGLADFHRDIEPTLKGQAEAGWALMPDHWGKGLATEALSAILAWYRAQQNARPVCCIMDPDNEPSNRLAAKAGFGLQCVTQYKGLACNLYRLAG
jgi:RimJ/RimL family protein N-acetyltransferase